MLLTPTKIKLDAGDGRLAIQWSDGHESNYNYQFLRGRCPCATCIGTEGQGPEGAAASPLPTFKKALRPERAEVVGRYALQIFWSDGHSTGLYTFPYLRGLCLCKECAGRSDAINAVTSDK
jgi:DUF971 family protein